VTVVAASGDIAAVGEPSQVVEGLTGGAFFPVKEVDMPASDPLVLGAGGTSLTASHTTGAYLSESAWGLPFGDPGSQFQGSGGGLGQVFSRPSYQDECLAPGGTGPSQTWLPTPLPTAGWPWSPAPVTAITG
jgi:subtilase family serine protease